MVISCLSPLLYWMVSVPYGLLEKVEIHAMSGCVDFFIGINQLVIAHLRVDYLLRLYVTVAPLPVLTIKVSVVSD